VRTVVVYVHGLWLTGLEGSLLRRRLARDLAAETRTFAYRSVRCTVTVNARALAKFLLEMRADTLHLVGHSLGGLVILKLFENGDGVSLPPGRIVLLGSPLRGSSTAHKVARLPFGKKILGRGVHEELLGNASRRWNAQRELGVIAGNLSIGLGRLVGTHGVPSDGTILVDETRLDGVSQHLVLRASHTGLPFSSEVARQTGAFLSTGRFIG
jgi:pimeloyl-ACP methyl ester carboxylesterase